MKTSISKKNGVSIRCVETGVVYHSMSYAEKETGISYSKISMVCNGKRKTAGGYHWEFVDEPTH